MLSIEKFQMITVPSYFIKVDEFCIQPGLDGAIPEVFGSGKIFLVFFDAGEVQGIIVQILPEVLPVVDQFFVDGIKLIPLRIAILQPEPLNDG